MRIGLLALAALLAFASGAEAQSVADARAFVAGLYGAYGRSEPDYLGPQAGRVFAPRLLSLIRRDARNAHGEVGALDGDPICDCQDAGGLKLTSLEITATGPGRAVARVRLTLAGDARRIELDLTAVGGRWRVADVHTADTPSLVRLLGGR